MVTGKNLEGAHFGEIWHTNVLLIILWCWPKKEQLTLLSLSAQPCLPVIAMLVLMWKDVIMIGDDQES